jgi:hypothetical protein
MLALSVDNARLRFASALTVSTREPVPVPPALAAPKVMVLVPTDAGVPEITPVLALMLKPEGRPLALNELGLFVAVIW